MFFQINVKHKSLQKESPKRQNIQHRDPTDPRRANKRPKSTYDHNHQFRAIDAFTAQLVAEVPETELADQVAEIRGYFDHAV
jgi:hypothetical protein